VLAKLLSATNRHAETEELYRETLRLGQQTIRESPSSDEVSVAATVINEMATFLKGRARFDDAQDTLQQGVEFFREILDEVPAKAAYRKNLDEQLSRMLKALEDLPPRAQNTP
jgi:hypothetical protein